MKKLILLFTLLLLIGCDKERVIHGVPIPKKFRVHVTTPGGVTVDSNVGVPQSVLTLIDDGIRIQLQKTDHFNWTAMRQLVDYRIIFIDPMGMSVNLPDHPIIKVEGINSAGTVLGVWNDYWGEMPAIVLPHQQAQNWQLTEYLKNSVWYESEHLVAWYNDRNVFFAHVGSNDIHPHFP